MSPAKSTTPSTPPLFSKLQHGGDYNPDQWLATPEIIKEDLRLMPLAHVNLVSLGIFAWSALEPEEGVYNFEWLDQLMDDLSKQGVGVALATPSGARPAWLSAKYPEVLRVAPDRKRNLFGQRHNHCYSSPVYREKVRNINTRLAERYGKHPALKLWHVSNEYGGECHCPLCQQEFRNWLKVKYTDLNSLNQAWYTSFWSHTYSDWEQIESPSPHGERDVHGHNLDWRRFVTDRTVDFMRAEIEPLRAHAPGVPVTTNFHGWEYPGLNYWKFTPHLDVISWDSYPNWHVPSVDDPVDVWRQDHVMADGTGLLWAEHPEAQWALISAFLHNTNRTFGGGRPFMLIESTPSVTNWRGVAKLLRPGMSRLASLQAVAHGADAVMYFQWRKSRGSSEKLHGAVVDHVGHENTRVFRDVASLGQDLEKLSAVAGTESHPEVAILYDWENRWALEGAAGPRNDGRKRYTGECMAHAAPFWKRGINFDVIDMEQDFLRYKVIVAPMLYMVREGVGERLEAFVKNGGVLVSTYLSGWANESDLCFLGGFPGPLRKVLGLWSEEIDALPVGESKGVRFTPGNTLGLAGDYKAHLFCDLIHTEGATPLATYTEDFYAGRPALTVNKFGQGQAYYIAARTEHRLLDDLYGKLAADLRLSPALATTLPSGVSAQRRSGNGQEFIFVMNFNAHPETVKLPTNTAYKDALNGQEINGSLNLKAYDAVVITTPGTGS
jgi:beta-galactosidase